ncbi:MAG: hypothetical protein J7M40_16500 [Planctomycetes bacterium]|nr:hypothetical protein [Planctomycetota bacterium]
MKQSPNMRDLEFMLRSSRIVAGGFLGTDGRSLEEIIDADMVSLAHLGYTVAQVADRMQQLTVLAIPELGNSVAVGDHLTVTSQDYMGRIICPWPHPMSLAKRITDARRTGTDESICWTDLSIHMIAEHNFFEGKGSAFRIEPGKLVNLIF